MKWALREARVGIARVQRKAQAGGRQKSRVKMQQPMYAISARFCCI